MENGVSGRWWRSQAKFIAEPELEPEEEALVGTGEGNAGDLLRACEPVTAGVGMNIEMTSRCGDIALVLQRACTTKSRRA
jgi:hypothetical protein